MSLMYYNIKVTTLVVGMFTICAGSTLNLNERAVGTAYSLSEQNILLEQHNSYRSSVSPRAVSMNELVSCFFGQFSHNF